MMVRRATPAQGIPGGMLMCDNGAWVRYSDYISLKAENERLTFANNTITLAAKIAVERAEAAERALAERAGGVRFVGNIPGSSSASGFAPLTTEPAAQEGRQPVAAWISRTDLKALASESKRVCYLSSHKARSLSTDYDTPLYIGPAEQAVTEAMSEAAVRAVKCHLYNNGDGKASFIRECDIRAVIRAALKAAMEAGR